MMKKPLAIIGMSPGNSYFKDYEVRFLLQEAIKRFGRCAIMVADVPAISTYIALGYPENKARNKAIPKGNNLKNRTQRIAEELGYNEEQVRIIDWAEEIDPNSSYKKSYETILNKFHSIPSFANSVRATSRAVLEQTGKIEGDLDNAVENAIHYLLSELAFMEFSPEFFQCERVCYLYHRNWAVYEDYIAGKNDGITKPYLDFLLLEAPYETYIKLHDTEVSKGKFVHDTYSRVVETNTIRAAYVDYPPIIQRTSSGFSGVFYDIISDFASQHGWTIEWVEETGYGAIVNGLEEGRFDIFCSATWPTPERHRKTVSSHPIYYCDVGLWVREDSPFVKKDYIEMDNPECTIAITENDITHEICLTDFTRAKWIRSPQMGGVKSLLEMVADGRATATMAENITYEAFAADLSYPLINIAEIKPIRRFSSSFLIGKNQDDFKDVLDEFIRSPLQQDNIRSLINKYKINLKGIYFPKS